MHEGYEHAMNDRRNDETTQRRDCNQWKKRMVSDHLYKLVDNHLEVL